MGNGAAALLLLYATNKKELCKDGGVQCSHVRLFMASQTVWLYT